MRQKELGGLRISRPSKQPISAGRLLPPLVITVVYALMTLTEAPAPALPALVSAAVCTGYLFFGRRSWFFSGMLALLALSLLILRNSFSDGFCQWFNGVGRLYTAGHGIVPAALEATDELRNLHLFTCWLAAALSVCILLLSQFGQEAAAAGASLLCGGVSLALGRMIDPLPLVLAALMLCKGPSRKSYALPAGILLTALLFSLIPGFDGWAGEVSESIQTQVHHHRYETGYTTLPEGCLEPLADSDAVVMIVTLEKPEVLYLRGFTGAQLAQDRWMPLSNECLAGEQELLYWLNSREFDLRAQFEAAASRSDTRSNTVTIQNLGACSAYRYIPFTIRADDRLLPEDLTQTPEGGRYDSFTTVYDGAAMIPELLTALDGEDSRYLQAEAAYREFVEANYLSIPEELAEIMQPYWDKAEGLDTQSAVKAVLESCWPDGAGRDPYYATAAVLTLRHFGIPARYAEGYILPRTTATTLELTGRHAACWAEVYQDGIGWIPMQLTPGLEGETEQQEQTLPPDTPQESLPPQTEPASEPEPDGGYQVRLARALLGGVIILLLLLLLAAAALLLRRRYILKKRQATLCQKDIREAVTWSFADAVALLERMGIRRGRGSLEALSQPIRERFGAEYAGLFEAAARINARALFSGKPLSEPERETVHEFRLRTLSCLQADSGRLSGLWMKYILCIC